MRRAGLAAVAGLALLLTACSGSGHGTHPAAPATSAAGATSSAAAAPAPRVTITPGNGAAGADPSAGITVTAVGGTLTNVTVRNAGDAVSGQMSQGGRVWHSRWALDVSQSYTVTALASGSGRTVTATSAFRTLTPSRTFTTFILEGAGQTYGVGMPITILFSSPVTHRAAVEKAIQIKTSKPVVGTWIWDSNESVSFRPQSYWPQHTKVSFTAHFNGLAISPGVYGTSNLSNAFRIGNSLIGVTSTVTHKTRIYWKGKLYATWPDSSGMPGDDTSNGTYLTIEKGNPVLMSGPGYKNVPVFWSVRFTWSGDYYHSAPWSVGEQGFVNVSHGCVNLAPNNAQWYYERAVPGDPITITGSPVAGVQGDGYTQWFYTWKQALSHSATGMAVQTGPTGSTMVDPSTLPAQTQVTFLTGSKAHNFYAK